VFDGVILSPSRFVGVNSGGIGPETAGGGS